MKALGLSIRWIIALLIVLFALATALGGAYMQTLVLAILATALVYWPQAIQQQLGAKYALLARISLILVLILLNVTVFRPGPKTSVYLSQEHRVALWGIYDQKLATWPIDTEQLDIESSYGKVHVVACGSPHNPPLMMIHAASMGAHSWAENLDPLLGHYRVYSIDNIGEGNKSVLYDAAVFPKDTREIADLYAEIADSLAIGSCPVFGASNGGFVAMSYACYYPERVTALALLGPMGLTPLTGKSVFMMSIATMYPFNGYALG